MLSLPDDYRLDFGSSDEIALVDKDGRPIATFTAADDDEVINQIAWYVKTREDARDAFRGRRPKLTF